MIQEERIEEFRDYFKNENFEDYMADYDLDKDDLGICIKFLNTFGKIINSKGEFTKNDCKMLSDILKMTNASSVSPKDTYYDKYGIHEK